MKSINFNFFVENDTNPFIVFDNQGKIQYLNISAEVLMGTCSSKEIFEIALAHAPQTFGAKKSILNLSFNAFEFYGINVLYENDEHIAIHLYNKFVEKQNRTVMLDGFILTDINMLLQANIELFNITYEGRLKLFTDYDIPQFQLHQNNLSLLLQNLFSLFEKSETFTINVKIKLGEQVVIKEKRYPIILMELTGAFEAEKEHDNLKKLAQKSAILMQFKKTAIQLEIPAIK